MRKSDNVNLCGLDIKMRRVLSAAERIWASLGKELIVTSACDGLHSAGSLHYYGLAVDLYADYFNEDLRGKAIVRLEKAIGIDYDIVNELKHIHVEYDPDI